MEKLFRVGIRNCATVYVNIKAESEAEARDKAMEFTLSSKYASMIPGGEMYDEVISIKAVPEPCSFEDVVIHWEDRAICVEFEDGSDALLQDNGYTLKDAAEFAKQGCKFFYD